MTAASGKPLTKKTILVALDGSTRAPNVLARAIAMAHEEGTQLVLMRAIGLPADVPQDLWKTTDRPLLDVLEERAKTYLKECALEIPPPSRGAIRVVVGSPWHSICETARGLHADLVVLGSHGYSGIDRLLGTTAAKVVDHSPCSVLVVRDVHERWSGGA
jgi:nucleotide-binding universal stress UspA family protein